MNNRRSVFASKSALLLLCFSIPLLILLLILGTWQVERLKWKEGLITKIEQRLIEKPVSFETIVKLFENGEDIEYRPVTVSGHFIHDDERHYFSTWQGWSGYYLHTPLELDSGRYVFINRGFVPFDKKEASTRKEGQVEGWVTIGGLSRMPETVKPSPLLPDNDLPKNIFYWRDIPAMAASTELDADKVYPFFIDADNAPNIGGLPVGGVTRIEFTNKHLEYAVTWYGLAFALFVVLAAWFIKQWRSDT